MATSTYKREYKLEGEVLTLHDLREFIATTEDLPAGCPLRISANDPDDYRSGGRNTASITVDYTVPSDER